MAWNAQGAGFSNTGSGSRISATGRPARTRRLSNLLSLASQGPGQRFPEAARSSGQNPDTDGGFCRVDDRVHPRRSPIRRPHPRDIRLPPKGVSNLSARPFPSRGNEERPHDGQGSSARVARSPVTPAAPPRCRTEECCRRGAGTPFRSFGRRVLAMEHPRRCPTRGRLVQFWLSGEPRVSARSPSTTLTSRRL
jgi:hypothetical protein